MVVVLGAFFNEEKAFGVFSGCDIFVAPCCPVWGGEGFGPVAHGGDLVHAAFVSTISMNDKHGAIWHMRHKGGKGGKAIFCRRDNGFVTPGEEAEVIHGEHGGAFGWAMCAYMLMPSMVKSYLEVTRKGFFFKSLFGCLNGALLDVKGQQRHRKMLVFIEVFPRCRSHKEGVMPVATGAVDKGDGTIRRGMSKAPRKALANG